MWETLQAKDYLTVGLSGLALIVSGSIAFSTFLFNRRKAARDLWQRNLELYIANPAHVLGRPKDQSDEATQAYRVHVSYIFLALEELINVFRFDKGWMKLVDRHVERHADYVRVVRCDPNRLQMYSTALQKKMMQVPDAHS